MSLPLQATRALAAGWQPVPLLTIHPQGVAPNQRQHLADMAGAVRLSTEPAHVEADATTGRTVPFQPRLLTWPVADFRFSIADRRIEIASTTVEIDADDALLAALGADGVGRPTYRLDLWLPTCTLAEVVPLMAGKLAIDVRGAAGGSLTVTLHDGEPLTSTPFPPGGLTRADFPDAPAAVLGTGTRRVIFGAFPQRVTCVPIDREGRRFYVCDPPASAAPQTIERGGVVVTEGVSAQTATTPTGWSYTEVTFARGVGQTTTSGDNNTVSVSGGIGVVGTHAIEALCNAAGLQLDGFARAQVARFANDFPLALLVNSTADAWSIVRDRLVPQTDCAVTLHRDRVHLVPLIDQADRHYRLGAQLLFELTGSVDQPDIAVANQIEVRCGLDHYASTSTQPALTGTVLRDSGHGTSAMRRIAAGSVARYGVRALAPVDAPDLAVTQEPDGTLRSTGGDRLADTLLQLLATVPTARAYRATWADGLDARLAGRVLVTHDAADLDETPSRVIRQVVGRTGVDLIFATGVA